MCVSCVCVCLSVYAGVCMHIFVCEAYTPYKKFMFCFMEIKELFLKTLFYFDYDNDNDKQKDQPCDFQMHWSLYLLFFTKSRETT